MATAAERGFSFKDLPTVIDPATEVVEIKVAPHPAPDGLTDQDVRFAAYHKIVIPWEMLPFTKSLDMANIYADVPDFTQAGKAFAYGADGILRAILYRDDAPPYVWIMEQMPEEFTGEHNRYPSVRFLFPDLDVAREVARLAGQLRVAIRDGTHYDGMRVDAQELINLVVGKGSEPRLVEVADPPQHRRF
jgi:hypothetical protein